MVLVQLLVQLHIEFAEHLFKWLLNLLFEQKLLIFIPVPAAVQIIRMRNKNPLLGIHRKDCAGTVHNPILCQKSKLYLLLPRLRSLWKRQKPDAHQ